MNVPAGIDNRAGGTEDIDGECCMQAAGAAWRVDTHSCSVKAVWIPACAGMTVLHQPRPCRWHHSRFPGMTVGASTTAMSMASFPLSGNDGSCINHGHVDGIIPAFRE